MVLERKVPEEAPRSSGKEPRGRFPFIKEFDILFCGCLTSSSLFPNFLFDISLPWESDNQWANIKALVPFNQVNLVIE